MSRHAGRFVPNQENELRRIVKEPVQTWKREWVQPDPSKPFKVLKYVKTGTSIDFATQAALEADKRPGEQDDEPEPEPEPEAEPEPVQEVDADEGEHDEEDRDDEDDKMTKDDAGAGEGGGKTPASALPAHMQAEAADAAAASNSNAHASTSSASSSSTTPAASSASSPSPTATAAAQAPLDDAALVNAAAGIPAEAAAALEGPSSTTTTAAAAGDTTDSGAVGGGGVQVASELKPALDRAQVAAAAAGSALAGGHPAGTATGGGGVSVTPLDGDEDRSAVPTRHEVRFVGGVATEVLVQAFTDRILVLVTQLGRVGCLIQATTTAPAHYVPQAALHARSLFEDEIDFNDSPTVQARTGNVPVSAYADVPTTPSGARLPQPSANTALLSLFGTPPAGQETLFSLYVSQIAAVVHARAGGAPRPEEGVGEGEGRQGRRVLGGSAMDLPAPMPMQEPDPRPVVVGLALRRLASASDADADEEEVDVLDEGERERFLGVMDMVLACRVW